MIVDSRRGVKEGDEGLLAWAKPSQKVHVLLSKADKLTRSEGAAVLKECTALLGERASVQLFSALEGSGIPEAQDTLQSWLA